ncbi:MAG TPA: hypothetical protein DEP36_11485 [Gammaproteobacteria bacterium]|nr:hypothetical protein [Gammaproteobacteria bacterium]
MITPASCGRWLYVYLLPEFQAGENRFMTICTLITLACCIKTLVGYYALHQDRLSQGCRSNRTG